LAAGGERTGPAGLEAKDVSTMVCKITTFLLLLFATTMTGCSGSVETTDDSTRIQTDLPKVEVGDRKPDLDPATDDDIDVDTPMPGDN
jgi:hypothetical protein